MLDYMRKNANSAVVWIIVGTISVVFVFFGVGPGGGQGNMIEVNGQAITPAEYRDVNEMVARTMRDRGLENDANFSQIVRNATVSEVANRAIISQFGEKMGLTPSDRAVAQSVVAITEFQTDGRFDPELYKNILKNMGTTAAKFEEHQRYELLLSRLSLLINGLSRTYRPEMLGYYNLIEDQVEFDYAFFPAATYLPGLKATPEQLQDYFSKNQLSWMRPAEMEMEYVAIKPVDFIAKATVSDDELRSHYEENIHNFNQVAQAEASHILIRFPILDPDQASKDKTLAKAQKVFARAATEDFATLAKEVSEDSSSASQGGSLGLLVPGKSFPTFDEAIFSAPLNQVTEPVETPLGYHLIKVMTRKEAGTQSFEDAKEVLLVERRAVQGRNLAVAQLEDLIVRSETSSLAAAAASMGLTTTRATVTKDKAPEFLENNKEALLEAFEAPLAKVANPLELTNNLVLYTPVSRKSSQIPLLEEVQSEVTLAWATQESLRLAQNEANKLISKATNSSWADALKVTPKESKVSTGNIPLSPRGLFFQSPPPFHEADPKELAAAIFSVAQAGEVSPISISGEIDGNPGAFALNLAKTTPADAAILTDTLAKQVTSQMTQQKASLLYQAWQMTLHKQAVVSIPPEYLN